MGAYDHEPRSSAGKFLRLTSKDQSVVIRLASEPYREPQVWKEGGGPPMDEEKAAALTEDQWARIMGNPEYRVSEKYSWTVIDRSDGKARIFSGAPSIYKNIKAYALMEEWGDPTTYDFKITRTEEPGRNYYTVMAMPNKGILSKQESLTAEALNIEDELPNARLTTDEQIDNISDEYQVSGSSDINQDNVAKVPKRSKKVDDIVIEDIDDGPINLDDIPF